MISVIIHAGDREYIRDTVKSLLLATPAALLTEVLLVDDTGQLRYEPGDSRVRLVPLREPVGRAIARNRGAESATGQVLIFLHHTARPADDWVVPLLEVVRQDPRAVAGPVLCGLDTNLWAADPGESLQWSWRWDLVPRKVYDDGRDAAVSLGPECLAVASDWFRELGGFDELSGGGEQQEFCLRTWLCGGKVVPVRRSRVAVTWDEYLPDQAGRVRTAEAWLGPLRDRFYAAAGLEAGTVQCGHLGPLARVQATLQIRDVRWFSDRFLPELGRIYELRDRYKGRSVGVVCDGPSLDHVNRWMVLRHDVVIGVDYVADLFPCNYVLSLHREPVRHLLMGGKYNQGQLVLPAVLLGPDGRSQTPVREVAGGAVTYELAEPGAAPETTGPPFVNYGHPALTAVQFAGFLGAAEVVLYGWDGRLVDGRSHTKLVSHYNDGFYWEDGEVTTRRFEYYCAGLEKLRRLLATAGVPVLRVAHA